LCFLCSMVLLLFVVLVFIVGFVLFVFVVMVVYWLLCDLGELVSFDLIICSFVGIFLV